VSEPLARRVRDEFFPKALIWPDDVKGLESLVDEAVTLKFISAPLTREQIADLVRVPAPAR